MTKLILLVLPDFSSTRSSYCHSSAESTCPYAPFFLPNNILILLIWYIEQSRRLDSLEQKVCFETQRGTRNPRRPASSTDSSYFPVHLNISKHFSWGQDTPFLLTLAILLPPSPFSQNSQPFSINGFRLLSTEPWVSEAHSRCLLLEYPRYPSRQWHIHILPVLNWDQEQWVWVFFHLDL